MQKVNIWRISEDKWRILFGPGDSLIVHKQFIRSKLFDLNFGKEDREKISTLPIGTSEDFEEFEIIKQI